ncbi:MAG: DNA-binding protein [Dechloromonas sp.]|nr:DNA-binding protein [Candidatus Dechloromonas phosphoritropha]
MEPQTLRASLCRNGHYMGLRPVKLPNGRLLWDAAEVERLTAGEVA